MTDMNRRSFLMTVAAAAAAGLIPSWVASEPVGAHSFKLGTIQTELEWDVRRSAYLLTGWWRDNKGEEFFTGELFTNLGLSDSVDGYRQAYAEALSNVIQAFDNLAKKKALT